MLEERGNFLLSIFVTIHYGSHLSCSYLTNWTFYALVQFFAVHGHPSSLIRDKSRLYLNFAPLIRVVWQTLYMLPRLNNGLLKTFYGWILLVSVSPNLWFADKQNNCLKILFIFVCVDGCVSELLQSWSYERCHMNGNENSQGTWWHDVNCLKMTLTSP